MRLAATACIFLLLQTGAMAGPAEPAACNKRCVSWPERFFSGHTEGRGSLQRLFSPARPIRVRSTGRIAPDGTLILQQRIRQGKEVPSTREWRLRRNRDGIYSGTLTDAVGPVRGRVSRDLLHLRYKMKGALPIRIEQWLRWEPKRGTVKNRLVATLFGLPVASLTEEIRKAR